MRGQIVKSLFSRDGQRRVDVVHRHDGCFGFVEMKRYETSVGTRWGAMAPYATITDTAESAEREARASVAWLIEISN